VKNAFLIGERIYLRPPEREDAPLIAGWLNRPEVRRSLRVHRPMGVAAEEKFLSERAQTDTDITLVIALREADRPVGVVGLHQIDAANRHAAFGIAIGEPAEWDKGYGSEALRLLVGYGFDTLNLERVWLDVYENNPRAIRAYERAGFVREGVLRRHVFREGRYWDVHVMGVLREEWPSRSPPP
jgi:UDP-4-amino-4,6-dideoxy-N-acetyl-beta-L-altrosamine N-acetyltransferase